MSEENIKPAIIPATTQEVGEMSAEEFQRTLLRWFEEHGVVSELRTHLRRNMVDILHNTPLGQSVSQRRTPISSKDQVINLLIAEFLMRNKYQFSLSVFSSEVPLSNVLPQYLSNSSHMNPNLTVPSSTIENDSSLRPTFTDNYFWEILDTLGFARDSIYTQKLHEFYFNHETNDSLLVGMLRLLASICNVRNKSGPFRCNRNSGLTAEFMESDIEPWLKDIYNLLIHFEVPDSIIQNLHGHLKSVFDKEHAKIRSEESTKFNLMHSQIQSDFQTREAEICRMINEMENTFYKEKRKLVAQVEEEQEKLSKMQKTVQKKSTELDDRLESVRRKEQLLQERENEVLEQTDVLKTRIKTMESIYNSINNSTNSGVKVQLPPEYDNLRQEIQETRESIQMFNQTVSQENSSKQKESEELLLKGMLERIETENAQLRNYNIQQQSRLDELSLRNSVLMTELDNCQTTISILGGSRNNNTITVPPLTAPPTNRSPLRSPTNYLSGGGETTGFNPRPPSPPPSFRNLLQAQSRDARRKASRRIVAQNQDGNSTGTEESPADDILQRARHRLRRLEQETSIVDHEYRSFKQRYSQNVQNSLNDLMQQPRPPSRTFVAVGNSNSFRTQIYHPRSNSEDIFNSARGRRPSQQPQFGSLRVVPNPNSSAETYEFTFANPTVTHPVNYPPNAQYNELNHPGAENTRTPQTIYESEVENYRSSASTNPIPQLQNISLSSVDISSDNPENTDNNFNTEEN